MTRVDRKIELFVEKNIFFFNTFYDILSFINLIKVIFTINRN